MSPPITLNGDVPSHNRASTQHNRTQEATQIKPQNSAQITPSTQHRTRTPAETTQRQSTRKPTNQAPTTQQKNNQTAHKTTAQNPQNQINHQPTNSYSPHLNPYFSEKFAVSTLRTPLALGFPSHHRICVSFWLLFCWQLRPVKSQFTPSISIGSLRILKVISTALTKGRGNGTHRI